MNWTKNIKLTKNKSIELQANFNDLFDWSDLYFNFDFRKRTDHVGLDSSVAILGYYVGIIFYDHRREVNNK